MTVIARWASASLLAGVATLHPAPLVAQVVDQAPAAGIALPFAPPTDTVLDYRIDQTQPGRSGTTLRFSRQYKLQFAQAGRGYRLDVTLVNVSADAPDRMVAAFRAALAPLLDMTIAYRLSAGNRTLYLDDPPAVRAALDKILAQIAHNGANGGDAAIARAAVARLSRLDDDAMTQLLFEEIRPLLQFAHGRVEASPAELTTEARDLSEAPIKGLTRLAITDSDAARVEIRETTRTSLANGDDGKPEEVVSAIVYTIDRTTGLSTRIEEHDTVGDDAGTTVRRKTRTLTRSSATGI